MDIDFLVTDRSITTDNMGRIPSGGINDVRCKFTFEEGYGWDSIPHITAIFARETKWAFQIEIQPDTYFYIPASCLARHGTCYVSLIGTTDDGRKVVQTTTAALLIEPNGLNRNTQVIYPINEHNEFDDDAYAQYVATVNAAANRAEEAARKLEDVVEGGYTKEEADERFMQKQYLSTLITKAENGYCFDISTLESIPAIKVVGCYPLLQGEGSLSNPIDFTGVNTVQVQYKDNDEILSSNEFTGFDSLYQLCADKYDYITVCPNGMTVHRWTQILDLKDTTHEWILPDVLRIDIRNENKIDPAKLDYVYTNVGNRVINVTSSYIDIALPRDSDLTDIKVIYSMDTEYVEQITMTGLEPIPSNTSIMFLKVKINANDFIYPPWCMVTVEANVLAASMKYTKKIDENSEKISNLERRVTELEEMLKNK